MASKFIHLSWILLLLSGCHYFSSKQNPNGERVIAKVNNEYLYLADLEDLVAGRDPKDSMQIVSAYAESWVKKKLLLAKAKEYISADDAGIEKKVESYRESLLLYEYEKELIRQKLDKAINNLEVEDYYEKNKANFILENDAYLVNYISINPDAEDLDKVKPLIYKSKTEDDLRALEGYCKSFARSYNVSDGEWKGYETIKNEFGKKEEDFGTLVVSNSYREIEKEGVTHYIKIKEIRPKGSPTPIDFVRDQIKEMLINKKKVALMESIYNKILEEGLKKKEVEILTK